jgi:hypothetical protein
MGKKTHFSTEQIVHSIFQVVVVNAKGMKSKVHFKAHRQDLTQNFRRNLRPGKEKKKEK